MLGKSIGSLHNVPAPSASVLNEALKLLATFGDAKSIGPLLAQMREVQALNEQVFREAQEAIAKLVSGQKELDESRKALAQTTLLENGAIKHRAEELSQAEARLSGRIAKFDQEQTMAKSILGDTEKNLTNRELTVSQRESQCNEKALDLEHRVAAAENFESDLNSRAQQLQAKERKLRAALDS